MDNRKIGQWKMGQQEKGDLAFKMRRGENTEHRLVTDTDWDGHTDRQTDTGHVASALNSVVAWVNCVNFSRSHDRLVFDMATRPDYELIITVYQCTRDRAGFKGGLGSCPGASTTKGPPQKTVKNYYLRKRKKYLWFMMSHYSFNALWNVYFYTFLKFRCRNL